MASSSLQLSPSALHCVWRKNILAASSRRTVLSSIRFQSTGVSQGTKNTLPWSEYLSIRRGKHKWEMVSLIIWNRARDNVNSILFPGVDHTMRSSRISWRCRVLWLDGTGCNEAYHGARIPIHLDSTSLIFSQGIDPLLFFGGATLGCMGMYCTYVPPLVTPRSPTFPYLGAGYLVGPILGSTLWRVTHRRTMALIEERDREFHRHIVRNRVDPTAQSAMNPVPDFYGEQAHDCVHYMY